MSRRQRTHIDRMIQTARAAVRCREAAAKSDPETAASLLRAADRYSAHVADIWQETASGELR